MKFLSIIGSESGLSPVWNQAIIFIGKGLLLIAHLGRRLSESLIKCNIFDTWK